MSDQPITLGVLAQFHREVILPDVQRIVGEAIAGSERRMQANFDAIFHKLDKLETEYELLKVGLARVEGRLNRVERRLDGMDERLKVLETQYSDLLAGLHRLEERLRRVEERLGRVEGQVDALAGAKEKDPLRAEVADLRTRVDSLQAQVRTLEKRFDQ